MIRVEWTCDDCGEKGSAAADEQIDHLCRDLKVRSVFFGERAITVTYDGTWPTAPTRETFFPAEAEARCAVIVEVVADCQRRGFVPAVVEQARQSLEAVETSAAAAEADQGALYEQLQAEATSTLEGKGVILTSEGYKSREELGIAPAKPGELDLADRATCQHLNQKSHAEGGITFSECKDCGAQLVGA